MSPQPSPKVLALARLTLCSFWQHGHTLSIAGWLQSNRNKQPRPLQGHCGHTDSADSPAPPSFSDETPHCLRLVNPPGSSGNWTLGMTADGRIMGREGGFLQGGSTIAQGVASSKPWQCGLTVKGTLAAQPEGGSVARQLLQPFHTSRRATAKGFPPGGMKALPNPCPWNSSLHLWSLRNLSMERTKRKEAYIQGKLHTLPAPPVLRKVEQKTTYYKRSFWSG